MIDIHDQVAVMPAVAKRGSPDTPRPAPQAPRMPPLPERKFVSVSDNMRPARPFKCAACGAEVLLADHEPLPRGWCTAATVGLDRKIRDLHYLCRDCSPKRPFKRPRKLPRGVNPARQPRRGRLP